MHSEELKKSIYPATKFGFTVMLVTFLIFIVWAGTAGLDSAAIATGQIVSSEKEQTIQHLEGGIIAELHVKEGDTVEKGQSLVTLSSTLSRSKQQLLTGRMSGLKATESRLIAEIDGKPPVFSEDIMAKRPDLVDVNTKLWETRNKIIKGQTDVLRQQIAQYGERIEGLKAQKKSVSEQLRLIKGEFASLSGLLKKGLVQKTRVLALERKKAELEGNQGEYTSQIAGIKESISSNELKILNLQNDYFNNAVAELKETQQEIAELREQLEASADVLKRTVITSPIDGIVNGLQFHTIGGVISAGTHIMDIIPQGDRLVIEAKLSPKDIDVVYEGLPAKVMLSAYRNRFMPRLRGEVIRVSADRFTDNRTGMPYYVAVVEIDEEELESIGEEVHLYPGMPAEVFIVTGSRTMLNYLFNPLVKSFRRAFKEE